MAKCGRPPGPPKKTPWELAVEGMNRVANNENPDWNDNILNEGMIYARNHEFFDINEINMANPDCQPKNPKSWGHLTNLWVSQKWCEKTGTIVTSKNRAGHCHKLCQLKSLIFDKAAKILSKRNVDKPGE